MLISMSTLKSVMDDLLAGGIDEALYQLYTTNRSSTSSTCEINEHLRALFEVLIYAKPEFCVRDTGAICLVDRALKWWLPPSCFSENTLGRLQLICSDTYSIFAKKWTHLGVGSFMYWSDFAFAVQYGNHLMVRRKMPADSLATSEICSMRAHICERMIFIILVVNFLHVEHDREQREEVWDATVSHIGRALLSLSLAVERELSLTELERQRTSIVNPPSIGQPDTSYLIHYYLNRLLSDKRRLRESAMRFADYFISAQHGGQCMPPAEVSVSYMATERLHPAPVCAVAEVSELVEDDHERPPDPESI